jgi:hypothetical protein
MVEVRGAAAMENDCLGRGFAVVGNLAAVSLPLGSGDTDFYI